MNTKPSEIFYLEDVLRQNTFDNIVAELKKPIWQYGRVTNPDLWDEDTTVFWQADLSLNTLVGEQAFYEIIDKLDVVFESIGKIRNQIAIKKDFAIMLRKSLLSEAFSSSNEMASS